MFTSHQNSFQPIFWQTLLVPGVIFVKEAISLKHTMLATGGAWYWVCTNNWVISQYFLDKLRVIRDHEHWSSVWFNGLKPVFLLGFRQNFTSWSYWNESTCQMFATIWNMSIKRAILFKVLAFFLIAPPGLWLNDY